MTTYDTLEQALNTVKINGEDVHLELAELTFIDLGGVTLLVNLAAQLGPHRRLILHRPPLPLRRVLGLLWADEPTIELDMR